MPIVSPNAIPPAHRAKLRGVKSEGMHQEAVLGGAEDLEVLVGAIAHDLEEPLRNLEHLVVQLNGDRALKVQAQDQIERARRLVDDLMQYVRLGAVVVDPAPLDLAESLQWALANLRKRIEETRAEIEIEALPTVRADRVLIARVFQNVIANALRFQGDAHPRVRITGTRVGHEVLVCVADQGIGIDPDHHDRIFEPLERLHGSELAGSGLGLAICRRLVERQGGRIWVESQPGAGAQFYFSVPVPEGRPEPR